MPVIHPEDRIALEPMRGWSGRAFHAASMTFVEWTIAEAAAALHEHHHEQEEVWHVVEGAIAIEIGGVVHELSAGMAAVIPSNTPHSARPKGPCKAIVCDHPRRETLPGVVKRVSP